MNKEVRAVLEEAGWSAEYIEKFLPAIEKIALLYDDLSGAFPESEYEGLAFFEFCFAHDGKPRYDRYFRPREEWKQRLGQEVIR